MLIQSILFVVLVICSIIVFSSWEIYEFYILLGMAASAAICMLSHLLPRKPWRIWPGGIVFMLIYQIANHVRGPSESAMPMLQYGIIGMLTAYFVMSLHYFLATRWQNT